MANMVLSLLQQCKVGSQLFHSMSRSKFTVFFGSDSFRNKSVARVSHRFTKASSLFRSIPSQNRIRSTTAYQLQLATALVSSRQIDIDASV